MKSRREFLQMGVAALSLPMAAGKSVAATPSANPSQAAPREPAPISLYKVVFDTRFPESVTFAEEAGRLGATVHGIRGDMTDLWYYDLDARWKKNPVAIAGLTAHGPMFCLEQLAWNHRMRVVFRAEHKYLPEGRVEHSLTGPENMLKQAADLREGADWPVRMANMVVRCPSVRSAAASATILTRFAKPNKKDRETLFSWVIAPVSRT
jgi:hypothetical protein